MHNLYHRTLYTYLRMCNKADQCRTKPMEEVIVVPEGDMIITSDNGTDIVAELAVDSNRTITVSTTGGECRFPFRMLIISNFSTN